MHGTGQMPTTWDVTLLVTHEVVPEFRRTSVAAQHEPSIESEAWPERSGTFKLALWCPSGLRSSLRSSARPLPE